GRAGAQRLSPPHCQRARRGPGPRRHGDKALQHAAGVRHREARHGRRGGSRAARARRAERPGDGHVRIRLHVVARRADRRRRRQHPAQHHRGARPRPAARRAQVTGARNQVGSEMDFGLTQDQVLLKDTLRRWLEAECPTTRVRAVMETEDGHDPALWRGLAELGVTGLQVPPAHGGAGLELLDVALAAEELGWACTPGPFLGNAMATAALLASDDAEVHRRWLPGIASGEVVATVAIGEEGDEWDAAKLATRAEGHTLHGEKTLVPAATLADVIVVAAQDTSGPGLWLVERGARGLEIGALPGTDMTRRVATITLQGTPATRLAGGRAPVDRTRDAGLVLLAADAYGGARRCIDMTARYALTREQFGQPIGAFQAVKHQLADI